MMDLLSLQMLLSGMGGQPGQQGQQPPQPQPGQTSNLPLLQMFGGAGVRSPLGGPWSAVSPPTQNAQAAMPILQSAMQPKEQGWMDQMGGFMDGMDPKMRLMFGLGGASQLMDALRGS
jgi:hypothetical protein